jgi:hypothetical protein
VKGQALIETAVTLPIMVFLFFGFLAVGVGAQAYVDLNTAVYLAAASHASAPARDPVDANQYATDTFTATVKHDPLLEVVPPKPGVGCTSQFNGTAPIIETVTCRGSATLRFSRTPLAILIPVDPTLSATATSERSPYRSELVPTP